MKKELLLTHQLTPVLFCTSHFKENKIIILFTHIKEKGGSVRYGPWRWRGKTDWQEETHEGTQAGSVHRLGSLWVGLLTTKPWRHLGGEAEVRYRGKERTQTKWEWHSWGNRGGCAPSHNKGRTQSRRASWVPCLENMECESLPWWALKSPWRFSAAHKYSLQRIQ